ncbi:ribonuclease III domain-containing protein [Anoxynatronum sibiricum]|uniref:Mini-ribonuclease 3 n=2 Tax=Anoxynatronum sibiricum TaxID=210623 RepID=A0ABU9VYV5_9CLOT
MLKQLKESGETESHQVETMAPLTLAYMGDALFEMYMRDYLIRKPHTTIHRLHRRTVTYVNAVAQAEMVRQLQPFLTDLEKNAVRRGRNQKSGTVPKNTDPATYRVATGFEALLGWLYYRNELPRLMAVMTKAVELLEKTREEAGSSHEAI